MKCRQITRYRGLLRIGLVLLCVFSFFSAVCPDSSCAQDMIDDMAFFSSLKDRSTGSPGAERAADYILQSFRDAGLSEVDTQDFLAPVPEVLSASVEVDGNVLQLYPWGPNMVYLPMTPEDGLRGRLIYVGSGDFSRFNGEDVKGSIVLMDMASYNNWMNASMLGAGALIFLGDRESVRGSFHEKNIPTPLAFPRFWVPPEDGEKLKQLALSSTPQATVKSRTRWQHKLVRNCYGLLPGKSPELSKELVVLDAFYDASSHILGLAPGAGESASIAALLSTMRELTRNPPDRSVLFVATVGNGQGFAGMRHFIWTVTSRKKLLRKEKKALDDKKKEAEHQIELIRKGDPFQLENVRDQELVWKIVVEKAKDTADALTREMQYQKALSTDDSAIDVDDPRPYRRISFVPRMTDLPEDQRPLVLRLLEGVESDLRIRQKELKLRRNVIKSAERLRGLLIDYTPTLYLSLHLSSNSPNMGLVELGESYPIMENIRRLVRATRLADLLDQTSREVSREVGLPSLFRQLSRSASQEESFGSVHTASQTCCDVAAIAGLPAVALVSLDDARSLWSTPHDTMDRVTSENIETLSSFLPRLLSKAFSHPLLPTAVQGGLRGFASLEGQAMFIRQGELFPDQPAPNTIISVLQGDTIFRAMSFQDGSFFMPGLANRRAVLQKLIVEPYGVDPETGRVAWTADKAKTGKANYRIKVKTDLATTTLVMFNCMQTDIVGVFNPRNMSYLTKVDLLDALTEATPLRYWYSRVDGRDTMAFSVFLEKGVRFKLVMSESLLSKELFLLNSSPEIPTGTGFLIGDPEIIPFAPHQVVKDLDLLLKTRLDNLSRHGINNLYLENLYETAQQELAEAESGLAAERYDRYWTNMVSAWAKMNVIYREIESTQRDVLTGVMFFIALFVPFAYCMERYLFSFRGIYQQITAFFLILVMTILAIRALHPAFQLTYSPMVVIVAFFIVGLSLLVSWIIFMRFENEMSNLHDTLGGSQAKTAQVSKWQAFGAGFSIGVSNLNRRKLRTALTCITLVILTFTVMSFTNVKTMHRTTRTQIAQSTPYQGILLRHQYWFPLTLMTLEDIKARFGETSSIWPRGWIDVSRGQDKTITRVCCTTGSMPVQGVLGVGPDPPTYFEKMITHGRWFEAGERRAVLLPLEAARQIGLNPETDLNASVDLMGNAFTVVGYFDGRLMESLKDLDQNPITPAYIEFSQSEELTEAEIEAMQSGEEILPSTERFRHASANGTIIAPFDTVIEYGGQLKAISILEKSNGSPMETADRLSSWLSFPLFVGQNGTWFHSATDTLRYQGAANLIVPILIVIFICLNTMIGHVHERRKEIATYTSVGLAPTHVGFLFIVEALSMAVIATVIGYILAQLSAKTMGHSPLFSQLTFNYSSLASVACMFLVFTVVFLAALYPAKVASEIAMPDVNRTWTLPPAEGDVITMNLPFLLKYDEEKGIMGFLNAFYASHQDVNHGSFIVDETRMDLEALEMREGQMPSPVCLLIRTNVWLAPFDFGIKQRLQLHCCPSADNPGYLEIALRMVRLSGERSAWIRANKNFIRALRKQMLLWRFMDKASKGHYQQLAPVDYQGQLEVSA